MKSVLYYYQPLKTLTQPLKKWSTVSFTVLLDIHVVKDISEKQVFELKNVSLKLRREAQYWTSYHDIIMVINTAGRQWFCCYCQESFSNLKLGHHLWNHQWLVSKLPRCQKSCLLALVWLIQHLLTSHPNHMDR